jgi:Cu-Zn family superoxide dismutase
MRRHPQGLTTTPAGAGSRSVPRGRSSAIRAIALASAFAGALASCASDDVSKKPPPDPGVGARLQSIGSTIKGLATFQPYDGGVTAAVTVWAGRSGVWRVVVHSTGVCTSPNGFAAGPPWIAPGSTEPPTVRVVTNEGGIGNATARLPGVTIDGANGIRGKSVVVHFGTTGSLDARPGIANDRVACGVIETNKPLSF